MNIFLVMLISLFMVGYYMFFAPSARIPEQETEYAISMADLRSIAECTIAVHNARISGREFLDPCITQHQITTENICLDSKMGIIDCESGGTKRPVYSFIITTTGTLDPADYNDMMEILEQHFATSGSFGLYQNGIIIAGGTSAKRAVPASIQKQLNLEDGQLIYMTNYDAPDAERVFSAVGADDIVCPVGTTKTYRFGRWQCLGYNLKTSCGGDMIWDSDLMDCVADESRKPLCGAQQTAVIVDSVWECINPFGERQCPNGLIARLNYESLEWECVEDPNNMKLESKCDLSMTRTIRGRGGATLRVKSSACNDCEKEIIDEESCVAVCVPDPDKINSRSCYPGRAMECSGASRGFYFGFPNRSYAQNVPDVAEINIPFDSMHSQNRKFNCLDCGARGIDKSRSVSPYIAICKD